MLTNSEIAKLLRKVAAVFEVRDNDFFRARAYQNAANAVENLTISARDLWEQGKLDEIPGVGPSLAGHLAELFKTGKVRHFDHELKRVPQGMFALIGIRGIGPKTAYKIAKKYKLEEEKSAISQIKKLIEEGKLKDLPGLSRTKKKDNRLLFSEALPIAESFLSYIRQIPGVTHAEPLGSIRRRVATVGDIDLAIATDEPKKVINELLKYDQISKVISSGQAVSRVQLKSGHEIDIKLAGSKEWGSLLQHYTGSKLHNIALRSYSLEKHLSLSEHGIKDLNNGKIYFAPDEKSFYKYLGLPYLPPELREGEEELELAKKGKIPKLVELVDIKGDIHIHSNFNYSSSHDIGISPLSDILDKARVLNYEYVGISDHNPKYRGLTLSQKEKILEDRRMFLKDDYHKYETRVKSRVPKLLIGLEVDIRKEGDLAIDDNLAEKLDYIIVSVHSSFDLGKEQNTKRLIAALNHPKVLILGHPTGRLLNKRESIEANWLEVFDFCSKNKKILEINASPNRLDLPDDLVKIANRLGIKMVIDSDSHSINNMTDMEYGVWTARRGWCTKNDIINTYSYADLLKVLR